MNSFSRKAPGHVSVTVVESAIFDPWLKRWSLVPDGAPIITPGSRLLPVRLGDAPAMLKLVDVTDEKYGNLLMIWWDGDGAARVLAHHEDGLLMERATGGRSLMHMSMNDEDDEASRILCKALARLHTPRAMPAPDVALACGSASTSRTFLSSEANAAARFTAVVVFPTPPF